MQTLKIPINNIVVGERLRVEYGDIEDLANSLDRYGQIVPLILDDNNNLIDGGRRLAAARLLEWGDVKVAYHGTLTEDEKQELEMEANVRRLDMTWQERVLAISIIHAKKQLNSALTNTSWGQRETGELLNMSKGSVTYALLAADAIRNGNEQVKACGGIKEVMALLIQQKLDETIASLKDEEQPRYPSLCSSPAEGDVPLAHISNGVSTVPLNCIHADALTFMRDCIRGGITFDHIVTDPPYAIDMDMLQQDNAGMDVSRTADEHDVEGNLSLLRAFIDLSYHITKDHSFCILWCDTMQWTQLYEWAIAVGWRVQRWPLVWLKTDPCMNLAAQYNFTKRTELAMVLRKPGATLNQTQSSNYYVGPGEDKALFAHPFAKPLGLWTWLVYAVSQEGQSILDPFAGSGTCPVATIMNGRVPTAVEIRDIHYNELLENVKRAYRQQHGDNVRFE